MEYRITEEQLSVLNQILRGMDDSLIKVTSGNVSHRVANIRSVCNYGLEILKEIQNNGIIQ